MRATQAERERDAATRIAVAEEHARIARELHDIVAHAVSVMVLQVGAVRHKLPDALAEDRDALTSVEQAGRTALAEMRRLLAAMRRDGDDVDLMPQPGLDGLGSLLEEIGRAGLPVRLHVDGEPFPLPAALDLSAYRIVQEGLTNALKHARASSFLLKDDPPEQLLAAIRIVAGGDALLSPAVTKRVIRQFARIRQSAPPPEADELTERELDVFRLITRGLSNAEISRELYISDTTVKTHITHILQKLNLRDRVQAVVLAYETGLFDADTRPPGNRPEHPAR